MHMYFLTSSEFHNVKLKVCFYIVSFQLVFVCIFKSQTTKNNIFVCAKSCLLHTVMTYVTAILEKKIREQPRNLD